VALKTLAQGFAGIVGVLFGKMKEIWKDGHEQSEILCMS
jgi:hypothetical protein